MSLGKGGAGGTPPPDIVALARAEDRLSFLYVERCKIGRDENAITVFDAEGATYVPSATLSVLMLGPGSSITHDAMTVIGESGSTVVWVGERGIRLYAFGKPLTHSSALLQRQAALVSNRRARLGVARRMYQLRFPDEDVSGLTMQQLRGREGARVRKVYRNMSTETGVEWNRREYNPNDFDDASEINKALSAAHVCLYALAHSVIVSLGCSPGLGFVHVGHERSFVYDVADLYKTELSIPVAFRIAALKPSNIGPAVRRGMRDAVYDLSILSRMVRDIRSLLIGDAAEGAVGENGEDVIALWDEREGEVPSGRSYGRDLGEG